MMFCFPALGLAQNRGTAVFTGTVLDSLKRPLANAEVSLPDLAKTTLTSDQGTFRVTDIPAGRQRIAVRRIGYGQLDSAIVFIDSVVTERIITLKAIPTLDSVVVEAHVDPIMLDFENNRKRGFGRFLTRADLVKMEGRTLGNALTQLQGLEVVRGTGGQAWVTSRHGPVSGCMPARMATSPREARAMQDQVDACLRRERLYYVPEPGEEAQHMQRACYAVVYFDRSLMNSGHPTPPFDLNSVNADQLEAVEWYDQPSQAPPRYSAADAHCGLAILYSRRPH